MSEAMQQRLAHSRAERSTTSCGECRRRKQRCDQRSPCGNCARRFPQPVCEYKLSKRIPVPGFSSLLTFTVTLRPERFADKEIPGTREPLLGGPEPTPPWANHLLKGGSGEVVIWSGVDMSTEFPNSAGLAFIGASTRPPGSGTVSSTWNSTLADMPHSLAPGSLVLCDEGCRLHSDAVHDAIKLIMHYSSIPLKFLDAEWNPTNFNEAISFHTMPATGNPWPLGGTAEEMRHLPMAPTRLNGELLRIYLKLLCRFKGSLDGNPEPNNPIIKHFVPFCVQDPLLLQIILYTSACFLNETGHLPRQLVMVQKGQAIGMLNEHLRSDAFYTSDAAIAAVVQLIIDEWYWGETQDLRAHLRGIRQMLKIRGGYHKLGMNGLLAKMVIVNDIAIALTHEINPFLQNGPEFQFSDPVTVPFRMSHNSPLAAGLASFADCAESLNMNAATASILDDMRFLIGTALAMPARPTPQQLQKVKTTATWMYERISKLDDSIPARHERISSPKSPSKSPPKSPGSPPSAKRGSISAATTLGVPSTASRRRSRSREPAVGVKGKLGGMDDMRSAGVSSRSHSVSAESIAASVGQSEDGTSPRPPSEAQSPPIDPALTGESQPATPDFAYQVVRQAALVYARAVMNRQSLAAACSPEEFLRIWTTTWRVPLSTWRGTCGVFLWIMLSIVTSCLKTPHERFVKSMLVLSLQTLGVDNWHVAYQAMGAGVRLQLWLRGEEAWRAVETVDRGPEEGENRRKAEGVKGMVVGGRKTIDRHGWMQPELWEDEGQTKCGG